MTINAPAPRAGRDVHRRGRAAGRPGDASARSPRRTTCSRSTSRAAPTSTRRRRRCGLAADLIAYCARHAPQLQRICVLRLPHPRGRLDGRAGDRVRVRQRHARTSTAILARGVDVDDFATRSRWIFNTHIDFFEEIAKYRALRRMWARLMSERLRRDRPARADAAHPHADGRLHADRAAAGEQHRARRVPGAGRGARRRAVAGPLLLRRGAGAPHREGAADRGAHAADHRRGDRRHRHRRPARRLVLRRVADRRARAAGMGAAGEGRAASAARSQRSRRASTSGRSTRRPTTPRWRWSRATASWWASTATARAATPRRRSSRSTRRSRRVRSRGWRACVPRATPTRSRAPWRRCAPICGRAEVNALPAIIDGRAGVRHARRDLRRDAGRVRRVQAPLGVLTARRAGRAGRRASPRRPRCGPACCSARLSARCSCSRA